ncbi:MAG TPA: sodium-dependent transporter [Bacteroidales bacterium]|nr:sodium-dependent transporter [Bacteroidales bacterium]HPT01475.1 sodium-dependent transporter [Bacteroidales bacterium]
MSTNKESWGTRVGLILAMAGNAVGLGNFLRFPMQAVQNGGGAFIIPYLVCFLLLGVPLLFVEWATGRYGGQFGHHTTPLTFNRMGNRWFWKYIGVFGIFSNIAIASYYCYIESWTLSYTIHSAIGSFNHLDQHGVAEFFNNYVDISTTTTGIPFEAIVFFVLCLALNVWVLCRGLSGGVEKVAKIGVPLLIVFGVFLAVRGITLKAGSMGAAFDGTVGLNFLWTPDFTSLTNPKVWLAAAGQIFFTLSLGQGSVQCYASYVKHKDDIALNAMSAGWMNEFVEVVLGSAIIIPISIGYFGIDKVVELTRLGGLGLGFRIMPYLFAQWGTLLSAMAGIAFFGLLFFAGITSSLAMGTPVMSFLMDEFNWKRKSSALAFGVAVLVLGLPTVLFFQQGVLDEYDYWAGTVSLVLFATFEMILFSWVFGMKKGWKEITHGADIKIPVVYRYIIKWITPFMLLAVFLGSLVRPANDEWNRISLKGWKLHNESIIGQLKHQGIGPNKSYFSDKFFAERDGQVDSVYVLNGSKYICVTDTAGGIKTPLRYKIMDRDIPAVHCGDFLHTGDVLYTGSVVNRVFYIDLARILLLSVFVVIGVLVYMAFRKRKKSGIC